jgi:hypothetical protein
MRGYLLFHFYKDFQGYATDYFEYDPFVWHNPYLLSFCHMNTKTGQSIKPGIVVLGLTQVDDQPPFCCSLVFYFADKKPLSLVREQYSSAQCHFEKGKEYHPETLKSFSLIADMKHSYIPRPAVPVQDFVDKERQRLYPNAWKPLARSWKRQKPLICLDPIDELLDYIAVHVGYKHFDAL